MRVRLRSRGILDLDAGADIVNQIGRDVRALMEGIGCDETMIRVFERQIDAVRAGAAGQISDADIIPHDARPLDRPGDDRSAIARTAVVRLNGGLGTSMGMDRAKSLLPVRGDSTFLDVIARQIMAMRHDRRAPPPITFLQSFRTSDECMHRLDAHPGLATTGIPLELMQHRVPKLLTDALTPVRWPHDPTLEWCPPGHGDIYTVFHATGYLDALHDRGFAIAFVANADNLGAVPDPGIAAWFARSGAPFAIEAVRRTANDRKGGHFAIRRRDGRLILRETAQTPPDELADVDRHPFASTNNIWFDVAAMRAMLDERGGDLGLPVIINRKTVDPADASSPAVVQLETAMGAAIEVFDGATTVEVGRDRFIPVKTTDDLLIVRSDCYQLDARSRLVQEVPDLPSVVLGHAYRNIEAFDRRFPAGPPSLVEARSLVVRGDWSFGSDVRIVGDVELGPTGGSIPDGAVLQGAVA